MGMIILSPEEQRALIRDRRERRIDRFDEVWDGTYIVSPIADNEHQFVAGCFHFTLVEALSPIAGVKVYPPINVTDRPVKWKKNYRCPDVSVFLPENSAEDRKSHWYGGPDFVIEIVSPYDRSRKKLDFYASVGVKELLLVDRKPWSLELYRLIEGQLKLAGKITPADPQNLTSEILPISFRLLPGEPRPTIEIIQSVDARSWLI
ncbi:Uma2 family endonuclease [Tundrisphaera lichenicola]|uniref:Uma2 family endonuclease n=1 Tax=Tundrisphaera lichenicola TaxID=2029860 RepID=UPI003EBADC43